LVAQAVGGFQLCTWLSGVALNFYTFNHLRLPCANRPPARGKLPRSSWPATGDLCPRLARRSEPEPW